MFNYLKDIYYSMFPFGTFVYKLNLLRKRKYTYETMLSAIEVNNECFTLLDKWQFRTNDKAYDLRAIVPRGKLSVEADPVTVEVDSLVHMQDTLRPVFQAMESLGIYDDIYVAVSYLPDSDSVACFIKTTVADEIDEADMFIPINLLITSLLACVTILLGIMLL